MIKSKKPDIFIIIIVILTILGSIPQLLGSIPIYDLSKNIQAGGIYLKANMVQVDTVVPSSPAAIAGIQQGDIITQANGNQITNPTELIQISKQNEGVPMSLTYQRNGSSKTITLTPRTNAPANQGAIGLALSPGGYIFEKEPIYILLPKTILLSYQGKLYLDQFQKSAILFTHRTPGPVNLSGPTAYERIFPVIVGLVNIVFAIGLLKLKKWGLCGFLILSTIELIILLLGVINSFRSLSSFPLLGLIELFIYVIIVSYLVSKRNQFT